MSFLLVLLLSSVAPDGVDFRRYVDFQDSSLCLELEGGERDACEVQTIKWRVGAWAAVRMLPESFLKNCRLIHGGRKISFVFRHATGSPYAQVVGHVIFMPILPSQSVRHMTREDIIFLALHEIGHVNLLYTYRGHYFEATWREGRPTEYAKKNDFEDFSESFALYVIVPDYLKRNFPVRYRYMKRVLGREYTQTHPVPDMLRSNPGTRLTVPY